VILLSIKESEQTKNYEIRRNLEVLLIDLMKNLNYLVALGPSRKLI